jgi:hypothetical protein
MKLISHFKKKDNDETKLAKKMSIHDAVQKLHQNLKQNEGDDIQKRVDEFIVENIDDDFNKKVEGLGSMAEVNLVDRSSLNKAPNLPVIQPKPSEVKNSGKKIRRFRWNKDEK